MFGCLVFARSSKFKFFLTKGDAMSDSAYMKIVENIDRYPMTAPKVDGKFSDAFVKFVKLLYTAEQAEVVQHLKMNIKYMKKASEIAEISGKTEEEVKGLLDPLAKNGRLIGFADNYTLPPIPIFLNVHQFYGEVGPDDIEAAELYQQFFIKDGYYKYYESSEKGTQIMRVIPVQRTIRQGQKILATEEAHKIIDAVSNIQLVPCPCRTRTEKMGIRECKDRNPVGYCINTETAALFFQSIGMGKKVTADEAKKYFDEMQDLGLVGTTDNYDDTGHVIICLCCGCCCSQLRGRTRWDNPKAVAPSNFVAEANDDCVLCGDCVDRCFFEAITLDEDAGRAVVDAEKCMGCGVCTITCEQEALKLVRVEREKPLADGRELMKTIAIENRE